MGFGRWTRHSPGRFYGLWTALLSKNWCGLLCDYSASTADILSKSFFPDMNLAEASLADGGVVMADDVFHQMWPGVAVGTLRYLQNGGSLAPFTIGFNKVFFAEPEYTQTARALVSLPLFGSMP